MTAPVETLTVISTVTVTKTQGARREVDCFTPSLDAVSTIRTDGVIVFSGEFYRKPSYLLNMQTHEKIILEQGNDEELLGFKVSYDHKWLAYQKTNPKKETSEILITGSDGKVVKTVPWDKTWRKIGGWLDDEILLISKDRGKDEVDSIVTLHPFTGERDEIAPDYPDMEKFLWLYPFNWGSFNRSGTIYNPTLTRVLYPVHDAHKFGVVLWNIPEHKKIVTLYEGYGNQPQWAPDEKGFMIDLTILNRGIPSLNQEFFYVDQNGETTQVTSLNGMGISASIGFFNWSPDGKSIAFWLDDLDLPEDYPDLYPESPAGYPNRLAVLDLRNRKVVDTCIPGDLSLSFPIWSPDGKYVVLDDYYGMDLPMKGRVWLANLSDKSVIKIAENVIPMGWMQP